MNEWLSRLITFLLIRSSSGCFKPNCFSYVGFRSTTFSVVSISPFQVFHLVIFKEYIDIIERSKINLIGFCYGFLRIDWNLCFWIMDHSSLAHVAGMVWLKLEISDPGTVVAALNGCVWLLWFAGSPKSTH